MNKNIAAILVIFVIGGGAYYIGSNNVEPEKSTAFEWSNRLQDDPNLGVAYTDITSITEVCPTKGWLIFKSKSRILLVGANRYHYSLHWNPRTDIVPKSAGGDNGTYNLEVTVKDILVTMGTQPTLRAYSESKGIIINDSKSRDLLKTKMLERLEKIAYNKLLTKQGQDDLTKAIKNHIYSIYANEKTKVDQINVIYESTAFRPKDEPAFEYECTEPIVL